MEELKSIPGAIGHLITDLVGLKNGAYTVIGPAERDKHGSLNWTCRCSCGRVKPVREYDLRNRNLVGCIHCARSIAGQSSNGASKSEVPLESLTDREFGYYTVIGPGEKDRRGRKTWRCRCRCGKIRDVLDYPLRHGKTHGCPRCGREFARKNYCGERNIQIESDFGSWHVVSYAGRDLYYHHLWLCRCKCGSEKKLREDKMLSFKASLQCTNCHRSRGKILDDEIKERSKSGCRVKDPYYLPTPEEIRSMCRQIRAEHGHSLAPDLR